MAAEDLKNFKVRLRDDKLYEAKAQKIVIKDGILVFIGESDKEVVWIPLELVRFVHEDGYFK